MDPARLDTALDRNEPDALHHHLRSLRDWAEDRLFDDSDPQHIAEYMTAVLDALLAHQSPPPPPV
ncbi:hypothetical protein ACWEOZ_23285 [Actinoplanes sp. NPDC004185]